MVPLGARSAAAVVGALLVLAAGASVVETLIVPRMVAGRLTNWVYRVVNASFRIGTRHIADYRRRDRVLAVEAATILLVQLAVWMAITLIGYGLLLWPFVVGGLT